ncbi:MAG: acyl-CoA carboxylase subunit beta [Anaerolineaceae bacterium]|nr:acyl-CoA carboxylase subunit beta [Anaerolineaceae bacterium]
MNQQLYPKLEEIRTAAAFRDEEYRTVQQHAKGKFTARERIEKLLDPGSFTETGMLVTHRAAGNGLEKSHSATDGVVTGWGKVDGRLVYVYAQDFTVLGGSLGEAHGQKIAHLMDLAFQNRAPIIGLNESVGERIQEGVASLASYGEIFYRNTRSSGVIPQLSVILGVCAGGAAYSPAINDFVFMLNQNAYMFTAGPEVVKAATHEEVDFETLGGAWVHCKKSGVAHFTASDEEALLNKLRWLLSYLPSNNLTPPPYQAPNDDPRRLTPELEQIIPADAQQPYDIHAVIEAIVDDSVFLEVQLDYAQNIVVGFARLDGYPVGVIANQPGYLAGVLDIHASTKGARFIRFCDAFHIPLLTLVDTPGFLPGIEQEHDGILRHGAKMFYAYAEATVPKTAVILRKAYGEGYIVMSSKHLRSDFNLAFPQAEIAVMGTETAVNIVFRKEIGSAADPAAVIEKHTREYRYEFANPYRAAAHGYLDDVINPAETRVRLIAALESLREKRHDTPPRNHGNIPL